MRRSLAGRALVVVTLAAAATALARPEAATSGNDASLYQPVDETAIREALDEVFAKDELLPVARRAGFGRTSESGPEEDEKPKAKEAGWRAQLAEGLRRFLRWLSGSSHAVASPAAPGSLLPVHVLAIVLIAVVIVAILRGVWGRWSGSPLAARRPPPPAVATEAQGPGAMPADEYLAHATEAARRGDYRQALRALLLGAMSWTERRRLIRHRRGLTNRDYLDAMAALPDRREDFGRIVEHFERVHYGRRPATKEAVRECLGHYLRSFSAG